MRTYRIGTLWTLLTCLLLLGSCHNNATLHRLEAIAQVIDTDPERLLTLRRQRIDYCREVFAHTPWRTRISQLEHSSEALTLKERTELQQVLIDSFTDVMIDFRTQCPALTTSDLHLVILTLLGCSIRTISLCTAISENALHSRKTRMKAKMTEEFYLFIFG